MSDKVFLDIVNMSITGSFAILIIILARLLLKKAPKVFSYALWFVAFFRLLVPVSFESVLSILPFNTTPLSFWGRLYGSSAFWRFACIAYAHIPNSKRNYRVPSFFGIIFIFRK